MNDKGEFVTEDVEVDDDVGQGTTPAASDKQGGPSTTQPETARGEAAAKRPKIAGAPKKAPAKKAPAKKSKGAGQSKMMSFFAKK